MALPFRQYLPGEVIGRFRVLSTLGVGGSCAVYKTELATDTRSVAKRKLYAIKIPTYAPGDVPQAKLQVDAARLAREFTALRRLRHPGFVRAYIFAWHEGAPYYAMKCLNGYTLAELIGLEQPTLHNTMSVFVQVVDALAYLHDKGICHRDLKPGNIHVSMNGEAVLLDFGLCRGRGDITLTGSGDILGTLPYVSPEYAQCLLKEGRDPSERYRHTPEDDVFALGGVLYYLIAGRTPWKASTAQATELLQEIRDTEQIAHPCFLNPGVPRPLADLALRLMARAGERPEDGEAALHALYNVLTGINEGELNFLRTPLPAVPNPGGGPLDLGSSNPSGEVEDDSSDGEAADPGEEPATPQPRAPVPASSSRWVLPKSWLWQKLRSRPATGAGVAAIAVLVFMMGRWTSPAPSRAATRDEMHAVAPQQYADPPPPQPPGKPPVEEHAPGLLDGGIASPPEEQKEPPAITDPPQDKPLQGQAKAPCLRDEVERSGACYWTDVRERCYGNGYFVQDGKCYVPVMEGPVRRRPSTDIPR